MIKARVPENLKGLSRDQLERLIYKYYGNHFQGKCVVNKATEVEICFNAIGKSKTAFGSKRINNIITDVKATAIMHLFELLQSAEFIGYADIKEKHKKFNAIGFMNFISSIEIDGKVYKYKISCMIRKGGKIHYSINENYAV